MIYQEIFNKRFWIIILMLIISIVSAFFFLFNKEYWENYEITKNSRVARILFKAFLFVIVAGFVWLEGIPITKDKSYIDNKNYEVCYGETLQEVVDGGLFGLSKSIIINVDGTECEFNLLKYDKNIKQGDKVKVTYLTNSKYAVIEKQE